MTELVTTVLVVGAALVLAQTARKVVAKRGPLVESERLVGDPAVIVFTADHCVRCERALELARSQALPVVQVRAEVDGAAMEALGVEAVPLTVVAGGGGRRVAQFGGVPSARRLSRAVARATNTATG
jgi:protein-disulfide isomerase